MQHITHLSKKNIELMYKLMNENDREICANVYIDEHKNTYLENFVEGTGKVLNEDGKTISKASCKGEKSEVIFHTHPLTSYAYPSSEDIRKVMKHYDIIRKSIISTKWGLWVITNTNKSANSYKRKNYDEWKKSLDEKFKKLGSVTKNSGDRTKFASVDLDTDRDKKEEYNLLLIKTIDVVKHSTKLEINFYKWKHILHQEMIIV